MLQAQGETDPLEIQGATHPSYALSISTATCLEFTLENSKANIKVKQDLPPALTRILLKRCFICFEIPR